MYRFSKSTVTLPDLPIFGLSFPPKFGWSSEIRGDRFTDFCVHTALSGNRLQKFGRLEKIGQWDHGKSCKKSCKWDQEIGTEFLMIISLSTSGISGELPIF